MDQVNTYLREYITQSPTKTESTDDMSGMFGGFFYLDYQLLWLIALLVDYVHMFLNTSPSKSPMKTIERSLIKQEKTYPTPKRFPMWTTNVPLEM